MIYLGANYGKTESESLCGCPAKVVLFPLALGQITCLVIGILALSNTAPFEQLELTYALVLVSVGSVISLGDFVSTAVGCVSAQSKRKKNQTEQNEIYTKAILINPEPPETRYYLNLNALCRLDDADSRIFQFPVFTRQEATVDHFTLHLPDEGFMLFFDDDKSARIQNIKIRVGYAVYPLEQAIALIKEVQIFPHDNSGAAL
jgi:hypothetical protein